jgi:hypothetical protein
MPIVAGRTKVSDEIGLEPGATVAAQPVTLGLLALEDPSGGGKNQRALQRLEQVLSTILCTY